MDAEGASPIAPLSPSKDSPPRSRGARRQSTSSDSATPKTVSHRPDQAASGSKKSDDKKSDNEKPATDPDSEEVQESNRGVSWLRMWVNSMPSYLLSTITHLIVLLILALWMIAPDPDQAIEELVLATSETEEVELEEVELTEPEETEDVDTEVLESESLDSVEESQSELEITESPSEYDEPELLESEFDNEPLSNVPLLPSELPANVQLTEINTDDFGGGKSLKGLGGRTSKSRKKLVSAKGGTKESEQAVEAALKWLVKHQNADGSWSLDFTKAGDCKGQCSHPGAYPINYGATGLALLPFLGAGQTHFKGKYQETVKRGLRYLLTHGKQTPEGFAFIETRRMYGHGIATIALCEAYGMTNDSRLRNPAQGAINYIVAMQSPETGSWGYEGPGNDTSILGWQMMAFKSAKLAKLDVPDRAIAGINKAMDLVGVQGDYGTVYYGYNGKQKKPSTTAVGTLSRMYMDWENDAAIRDSANYLASLGPQKANMYINYYGTQIMFQMTDGEGPVWAAWNVPMRDFLVRSQVKAGHAAGSWNVDIDHYGPNGGRLYVTCMAAMVLEVYYRHMPIYQDGKGKGRRNKRRSDRKK